MNQMDKEMIKVITRIPMMPLELRKKYFDYFFVEHFDETKRVFEEADSNEVFSYRDEKGKPLFDNLICRIVQSLNRE